MDLNAFAAFLGGIGAGSVLSALIQHFLTRSAVKADFMQQQRITVYSDLLHALEMLEVYDSIENKKKFGFCAARVEIFASERTRNLLEFFRMTDANTDARGNALRDLLASMRSDLFGA